MGRVAELGSFGKNIMKIRPLVLAIISITLLSGCMTQRVLVVDNANLPIADADVEPISLSIHYAKVKTNKKGIAALPHVLQPVVWVSVNKEGYTPSGHVSLKEENPMVVSLRPSP